MRLRYILCGAVSCLIAMLTAACGGGGNAASSKTITVVYYNYSPFVAAGNLFKKIIPVFEKEHPGWKVNLEPIDAAENDYYTKLDLMSRSASTAPDVAMEDTFLINSDVQAGYLAPLNGYLSNWPGWKQFYPAAQKAAQAQNGKVYGVPMGGGTAGLWYNKKIFAKAGLPVPWHPKTWADVLAAARAIKQKAPGVIPLNVYAGTPAGEYSSLWGFQMLLYSTGEQLYDHATGKWIAPGAGFVDSLKFLKTIYGQKLAPAPEQELNPNITSVVASQLLPKGKLAIDLDGAWLPGSTWMPGNAQPWAQWSKTLGWTGWPTRNGQSPGEISMDGGWTLAIGSHSPNKAMDFDFIKLALDKQNTISYDLSSGNLADRKDAAANPSYLKAYPGVKFWTGLGKNAYYRPAYSAYPRISNAIQQATEQVVTGQESPQQAASAYGQQLRQIVRSGKIQSG